VSGLEGFSKLELVGISVEEGIRGSFRRALLNRDDSAVRGGDSWGSIGRGSDSRDSFSLRLLSNLVSAF